MAHRQPSICYRRSIVGRLGEGGRLQSVMRRFQASAAPTESILKRDGTTGPINKARGFIEIERQTQSYRPPADRLEDWEEINKTTVDEKAIKVQASRCMDCGTPFCQTNTGCPVNNLIPEWNELIFQGQWKEASDRLHKTNNFPEFTGRVCPAPCEGSCVAGLVDKAVTIKDHEYAIVDRAFQEGWIKAKPPTSRTGKKVAIIGSGPAGLAAADQLNKMGHQVTIYEREDHIGGLLVYGIPNMKLSKESVRRRLDILEAEGVTFVTNSNVGVDIDAASIRKDYHAVILAVGATKPRDLPVEGRDSKGIHFAMEFLTKNQKRLFVTKDVKIQSAWDQSWIDAKDKNVVVIGGGDTGTDCLGTSLRMGCKSLVNFELMEKPTVDRTEGNPWPEWPRIFRVDYGHSEGQHVFGQDPREYEILTKKFTSDGSGNVSGVVTIKARFVTKDGKTTLEEQPGSEKHWPADLVLLSMGFVSPEPTLINAFKLRTDAKSNIKNAVGAYGTSVQGVFTAGDCRRGQSLVVWAINEGRGCADQVHEYLYASEKAANDTLKSKAYVSSLSS